MPQSPRSPQSQMDASDHVMQLVFDAVEHGMKPLRLRQPLVPFTLRRTKEGVVLSRFEAPDSSTALARAKEQIATDDADTSAYVLAYDAYVTVGGTEYDAILLEAGERDSDHGWRFAQRYRPASDDHPAQTIGEVAFMGQMSLHW